MLWACRGGHLEILKRLLDRGAKISTRDKVRGWGWQPRGGSTGARCHGREYCLPGCVADGSLWKGTGVPLGALLRGGGSQHRWGRLLPCSRSRFDASLSLALTLRPATFPTSLHPTSISLHFLS